MRNTDELRLRAVYRIAEDPAACRAVGKHLPPTLAALAARPDAGAEHRVPHLNCVTPEPTGLMTPTHSCTSPYERATRHLAFGTVQVRAADRGTGNPDDRVGRRSDPWLCAAPPAPSHRDPGRRGLSGRADLRGDTVRMDPRSKTKPRPKPGRCGSAPGPRQAVRPLNVRPLNVRPSPRGTCRHAVSWATVQSIRELASPPQLVRAIPNTALF